ncbi:hypothetical protein PBRA_006716 [Plasmodiophora brassicae]|uniref:Uncharacterized protein n=1 Tax=Plasmodiophora brassicae TaxID=37360 RepID=A0A0G4ITS6_PLABS|nr:hypothetical protein PBRA_006716 [Plasmodiophora brassicae]
MPNSSASSSFFHRPTDLASRASLAWSSVSATTHDKEASQISAVQAVGEQKCGSKSEPQRLSLSTCIGTCNEGGRWSSVQVRNHPVRADSFVILLCGNIDIDSIRQLVACA